MAKYASPRSPRQNGPAPPSPLAQQLPLVSGRWLAACLLAIFGGGLALVYLTMCLLFWQGHWQILFHPVHPVSALQSTAAGQKNAPEVRFQEVRFDPNASGAPQLDGFLLPAEPNGPYATETVLYLQDPGEQGAQRTPATIKRLQTLGLNLFAFDYRGYGASATLHPSEQSASEDTEAAWHYLVDTRHVRPGAIVIYGQGLAASLAADAAARHPDAAGVVLDQPAPPALEVLSADPRSHWMPVRLLTRDRFDPSRTLNGIMLPKLFLFADGRERYARDAAGPKMIVHLPGGVDTGLWQEALQRFLDQL